MELGVKSSLSAKEYFGSESPSAKPFDLKKGHILTVYLTNLFSHPSDGGISGHLKSALRGRWFGLVWCEW
jgi:hypothetical protein